MGKTQKRRQQRKRVAVSASKRRVGRGTRISAPRATGRSAHRHSVLVFLLIFGVLASLFYAITFFWPFYREQLFPLVLRLTTKSAGAVLAFLGQDIAVRDIFISSPGFSVRIVRGCDAVEPMALFVCAVLAFPSPLLKKLPGIVAGMLILALLNLVRIVSLFLIGVYAPSLFGVMHVDVWQGVFIVLALVLWLLWLLWATQRPIPATQAST